ncbi:MAG: DUF87 domain-containing protein [Clostridia bacterium]|nr:DUF87 domain-containing protein [Clostridia bacterium]
MRMVPKKSKVNSTLWKNFSLFDLLLVIALLGIALLIAMTNFTYKWIMLAVYAGVSVMLFFSDDNERVYNIIVYLLKFFASRKRYEKGAKSSKADVSNLIPFDCIEDDGIVNYGSYFGAVISIGSVEFALLDEYEQNKRITVLARLLNMLGESSVLQIVKIDRPINYDEVAAPIFQKLEVARAAKDVDKVKVLILQSRLAQIDTMNNIEKQYRPFYYFVVYENDKKNLYQQINLVCAEIGRAGLDAELLSPKSVAVFFKYCYSRNFDEREIEKLAPEEYANWIKPNEVKFTASSSICDGIQSFTCAVSDYPLFVTNAWGAGIFNIDNTKVVLTIKPVEKGKAIKRLDRAVVELQSQTGSGKLSEAISQETNVQTIAELAQTIQNENELLFDCTLTITGFNNTREPISTFKKAIRRDISSAGFKLNFLHGRQFDAFAAATVSKKTGLRRLERGINSETLAAVFPFVFSSIIETEGLTLGYDNYPVVLDIWKRNQRYINSNIMVLGKSGSGKSFFTKTLLSLVYSENTKIYVLDPENEYLTLCRNVGGRFIDVGNATEGRINPLHVYQILTDDGNPAASEVIFAAHLQFLESFFRVTLAGITSDSLEELNNILSEVYEKRGITEQTDFEQLRAEDYPTFDDLLKTVEEKIANETLPSKRANLERVQTYVAKFASGGRFSTLWNGPSTLSSDERFVVFNFQSLLGSKNNVVANAQMLVIMRYLDQQIINIREQNRAANAGIHPFVAIDEGYNFIDPDYPIALDFVYQWYKRIRKYNGAIMFLTQNLSDIIGNTAIVQKTTAIINNTQYSFIFSLAAGDLTLLTELYRSAGEINDTERNQILNAGNGECFVICSPGERAGFKVVASDVVYTLFDYPDAVDMLERGDIRTPYK